MVKRRVIVDEDESDEDDVSSVDSHNNKRSRVQEDGDAFDDADPSQAIKVDEDGDTRDADQRADREFEEHNEAAVRQAISKKHGRGTIAQYGVLKSIELQNFMCHRHLTFDFNPQVNFIIGRNGSGKSAVLSGLQLALGARTYLTGRGSSAKALVQDGRPYAEVTVKIKNGGPEAWKPDVYGDTIIIYRRIKKDGTGNWQMRDQRGKCISTRKADLQEMSEHMNIQIDSPLNILTQDAAKQFLNVASPTDKYAFFLKGTLLAQLAEEYEIILANIKKIETANNQRHEGIPKLRSTLREAEARLGEAAKARDQAKKIDELKNELAWSHVASKHEELQEARAARSKAEKLLPKCQDKADEAKAKLEAVLTRSRDLEEEMQKDTANDEALTQERQELNMKIKKNSYRIREFKREQDDFSAHMVELMKTITNLEGKIAAENQKLEHDEAEKREQLSRDLERTRLTLENTKSQIVELEQTRTQGQTEIQELQQQRSSAQNAIAKVQENLEDCLTYRTSMLDYKRNKLNLYGHNIDLVLRDIEQTQWAGSHSPIGPFGLYVNLTDGRFRDTMQINIGQLMFQFAVSHPSDRVPLLKILERHGNKNTRIIIGEVDLFDFSRGMPRDPRIQPAISVLDISDEWVKRIIVNNSGVERNALALTRKEADDLAVTEKGRIFWTQDCFRVQVYPDGGGSSVPQTKPGGNDSRRSLFSTEDPEARLREADERAADFRRQIEVIQRELDKIQAKGDGIHRAALEAKAQLDALQREVVKLERTKSGLEDKLKAEDSVQVAVWESSRQANLDEYEKVKAQFEMLDFRKLAVQEENRPWVQRAEELRERADKVKEERDAIRKKLEGYFEETARLDKGVKHYQRKLDEATDTLLQSTEKVKLVEEEYATWHAKAADYCDEVLQPRQTIKIQKDIEALEKALKQREKRHGATVDEMELQHVRAKHALETATKAFNEFRDITTKLRDSVDRRMTKWHAFRRHIALSVKIQFGYHLSSRGYMGTLLFDHTKGTLDIKVQTEEHTGSSKKTAEKNTNQLSGGEKSYTQICLLLALWDFISSPIRCLDEFDVFMDQVNRGVCMKLMIDAAKTSQAKQYIFISPLDIGTYVQPGPQLKVNRMPDPERGQAAGQTSLQFEQ